MHEPCCGKKLRLTLNNLLTENDEVYFFIFVHLLMSEVEQVTLTRIYFSKIVFRRSFSNETF